MTMSDHSQILVVSRDRMLLQTRKLILGTYFEVESAGRMSEAGSILSKRDFDLIVLCDTLSNIERRQIADMISDQRPKPTLLSLIGPGNHGEKPVVGRELACIGGPLQLLKECADVLGFDLHANNKQRTYAA
jgi:DNA-binding response OmpR family regulator